MRGSALSFLLLIFLICYIAGMYRSLPLMVLGIGELLLFVIMAFLSRHFLKGLSVGFTKSGESAGEGSDVPCHITVKNSGRLPVGRFELRLHSCYVQDDRCMKTKLYGGAKQGESSLMFLLSVKYCGMVRVEIDRLRVFDYLFLFRAGKTVKEEMKVAVFPKEQALDVRFSSPEWSLYLAGEDETISLQGDAYDEIRQIREYQSGDSTRHIHWNQSARTDSLWIKEYERKTDWRIDILIDSTGVSGASAMKMSAFYRTLFALVLGILKQGATVRVQWYPDGRDDMADMDVTGVDQCRDMLLQLYQTKFSHEGRPQIKDAFPGFLRLTWDLTLFRGEEMICQFSLRNLDSELQKKIVNI